MTIRNISSTNIEVDLVLVGKIRLVSDGKIGCCLVAPAKSKKLLFEQIAR